MDKRLLLEQAEELCDKLEVLLWRSSRNRDEQLYQRVKRLYDKALDRNIRRYDGLIATPDGIDEAAG